MRHALLLAALVAATPALAQPITVHDEHAQMRAAQESIKAQLADLKVQLDRIEHEVAEHRKHEAR